MTIILTQCYRLVLTVVSIFLIYRYKRADNPSKIICLLVWLGLLTETIGYYAAKAWGSNYLVFNISFFAEFVLISLYFNYSDKVLRRKNIGIYVGGTGILLGVLNSLIFQNPEATLNTHFLFLQCIVVLCFSMLSFFRWLLAEDEQVRVHRQVHLWLPCILLFNECATLAGWGLYELVDPNEVVNADVLDMLMLTGNMLTYIALGVLFLLYPKLERGNASDR